MTGARILVLALGNDLMGDDAVGLLAARRLAAEVGDVADVEETGEAGLALIELMSGYDRVLLLDAVVTGQAAPGEVVEVEVGALRAVEAPSPHYAGLPEVFRLAGRLALPMPAELRILPMEVREPREVREGLTAPVEAGLPRLVAAARGIVRAWAGG